MAQYDMIMPKMGEIVAEATITKWLKNEGDKVAADESVLEIATDKVDSEVPAQKGGILIKKLFKEGDVVQVGTVIAVIADSAAESVAAAPVTAPASVAPVATAPQTAAPAAVVNTPSEAISGDRFYSPLVRSIAKEENISVSELDSIKGSGKEGRVTKEDVLNYISSRKSAPVVAVPTV